MHHIHDDMVLGHEGVGVVEAVGDAVSKFKVCVFTSLDVPELY